MARASVKTTRAVKRKTTAPPPTLDLVLSVIKPMTKNQDKVFKSTKNQVLHGCAGTGKTFISAYLAYRHLLAQEYEHVIFVRSAVSTRPIGHLPGSDQDKNAIYESPYAEITAELFKSEALYKILKDKGIVKFLTTSFIRGRTLRNSVVIVDECQNMDFHELDTVITRFGKGCKYFFCGDFRQSDLKDSGITKFFNILKALDTDFEYTEFTSDDIVRSDLVKRYIIARNKHENVVS